jgi:hypothetical protein
MEEMRCVSVRDICAACRGVGWENCRQFMQKCVRCAAFMVVVHGRVDVQNSGGRDVRSGGGAGGIGGVGGGGGGGGGVDVGGDGGGGGVDDVQNGGEHDVQHGKGCAESCAESSGQSRCVEGVRCADCQ